MEKRKWAQPPYATTLMGCMKGIFDYYGIGYSPAMLFGLTGHAFFINIHKEICLSSPYVWNHEYHFKSIEKLGVKMTTSPSLSRESTQEIKKETIERLSSSLDGGNPCMATCLEHQLVKEIRDKEIHLILPWEDDVESQFESIETEDFSPCLDRAGFLSFNYFEEKPVKTDKEKAIRKALLTAKEMFSNPTKFQSPGYQSGFGAYEYWISALQKEEFDPQGHWWNGMVWSECREMGSSFFQELIESDTLLNKDILKSLAGVYRIIADRIYEAKEIELDREKKIILLTEALEMEYEAQYLVDLLLE
jgi:hypothetical protein